MKKIGALLMIGVLCLSGCGAKENSRVCKVDELGMNEVMTLNAKGDLVTSTHSVVTVDMAAAGLTDETQQSAMKSMMEQQYTGLKGVDAKVDVKEGILTVDVTIDFKKVDASTLVDLGLMDDASSSKVSLEKSIEGLQSAGYTCE